MQRGVEVVGVAEMRDDFAPLMFVSKKPSSMRFSGGSSVSGLSCISFAVSSLRMRLPLYSPFWRCAIMKCAISSPGEDSEPAGAGPTISNFFAGCEACA